MAWLGRPLLILMAVVLGLGACRPAPPPATPPPATPPGLFLEVTQPQDESLLPTRFILVEGRTSPEAVVSINGEMIEVNGNGNFTAPLVLEEGPNLIQVVASDYYGNQVIRSLVVISVPQEGGR